MFFRSVFAIVPVVIIYAAMLADPCLKAEFVSSAQHLQVPLLPIEQAALGRMQRHGEKPIIHVFLRSGREIGAKRNSAT